MGSCNAIYPSLSGLNGACVNDISNVATVTRVYSGISFPYTSICGSVAELSARRTRNPAVPSSSPAFSTSWIVLSRPEFISSATLVNG